MEIKPWDMLSYEEQNLYLTLLWKDGHSEKAIANFLSTTKGRIVRRRQTVLKLPTANRGDEIKQSVNPERFEDLHDLHKMEELEKQGVAALTPRGAPVEEKAKHPETCRWPLSSSRKLKPVLCGKDAVPGHQLCEAHLAAVRPLIEKRH